MQEAKNQSILTLLDRELNQLLDAIGDVAYLALPSERPEIICFSGRVEELSGYSADEILGDRQLWIDMIHPDDRQRVFAAFDECRDRGTTFEIEYRIIHKDGSAHYVIDKGEPVLNDKVQIAHIEGIITDVSKCERAEHMELSDSSFGVAELKRGERSMSGSLTKAG